MAILSEIRLKDSYTSQANKVVSSMSKIDSKLKGLEKTSKVTDSALKKTFGGTYDLKIKDVKSKKVRKDLQSLQSDLKRISGKNYQVKITAKEGFNLKRIKGSLASLGAETKGKAIDFGSSIKSKAIKIKADYTALKRAKAEAKNLSKELGKGKKVSITADGSAIGIVSKVKDKLSSLKNFRLGDIFGKMKSGASGLLTTVGKLGASLGLLGGATLGAGAVAGVGSMVSQASGLEQQKVSMTHFLGGDEKASNAYIKKLRKNANATPFETGEVLSAGTRAVQIAGGDTKKGMKLVGLAEDMAALNPGKTISDAMEALADAIQKIIPFWRLIFSCFIEVSPIL